MTSFEYFARLAALAGKFMCQICYYSFPNEDAWADSEGQRWDLCQVCGAAEEVARGRASGSD